MTFKRRTFYRQSGERLLEHLDGLMHTDMGYPDEPSWGYAFTYLASLYGSDGGNTRLTQKSLNHLVQQDKSSPNYSWEFVVYALQAAKTSGTVQLPDRLNDYREKGTRMFNWYLLRTLNRRLCGRYNSADHIKLFMASKIFQQSSGLILDEFQTRSLQYHAFCLFVLAELIELEPQNIWLKNWFIKGINFSLQQILSDGTSLYIGRGQEQIFGYGALIYSLEFCNAKVQPLDENKIHQVSDRLLSFQRTDGSYPLVLRSREPEPINACFSEPPPGGWYGYNIIYDYQPFLAYCLLKSSKLR